MDNINLTSENEIVDLKNKCIQYQKKSMEELKKSNEEIMLLEEKIQQMKDKNASLEVEIDVLSQEYKDLLQKGESNTKEDSFTEEKRKLEELKLKHDGLLAQLNAQKHRSELMNDPGYLNSLVMYWTPQAMFKYTQAYNMQSKT